MPNTAFTQQALAIDTSFATRVKASLLAQAFVVLAEVAPSQSIPPTPTELAALTVYNGRHTYARRILNDADAETRRLLPIIVQRTNLMAFTTSYDFTMGHVVTAAGDPDILSQLATDWNLLAGI